MTSTPTFLSKPLAGLRVDGFDLPPINADTALFLDFDGTLADLAATPHQVELPQDVVPLLRQLAEQLQGALAIVSGRPLAEIDAFLAPLQLPCAAEHGAVRRLTPAHIQALATPDLREVVHLATAFAQAHAGVLLEVKSTSVALHYRQAPHWESAALHAMQAAANSTPGLALLHGKLVFEIKPAGVSKGTAIEAFMSEAPFAGRHPIFAGDDVTDESGFASVQLRGGSGIKVGEGESLAHYRCAAPSYLRAWLRQAANLVPQA